MNSRNSFNLCVILWGLLAPATHLGVQADSEKAAIGTAKGEMVPDFLLPSLDGGFIRLSDYRGKRVFLFHFASW